MKTPSGWPQVINIPQTTTWLALIVLGGMWYYHDQDWKELTMMVLSYYFGKQQAGTVNVPTPVEVKTV